jgi:hypothetical protein
MPNRLRPLAYVQDIGQKRQAPRAIRVKAGKTGLRKTGLPNSHADFPRCCRLPSFIQSGTGKICRVNSIDNHQDSFVLPPTRQIFPGAGKFL